MTSIRRAVAAWLATSCGFVLTLGFGCGTDAVGVEECREIEQARCEVALPCRTEREFDVAGCKAFYRDHCLHGLRLEEAPGEQTVKRCVRAIRAAGACAAQQGAETAISACGEPELAAAADEELTTCSVLDAPERVAACAFLVPAEPVPAQPDAGAMMPPTMDGPDAQAEPDAGQ
jgi:hypothetical protein